MQQVLKTIGILVFAATSMAAETHPILPIGSGAPDFALERTERPIV